MSAAMASDQHSLLLQDVEAGVAYEHDEPEAASNLEIAPALHRIECPPLPAPARRLATGRVAGTRQSQVPSRGRVALHVKVIKIHMHNRV